MACAGVLASAASGAVSGLLFFAFAWALAGPVVLGAGPGAVALRHLASAMVNSSAPALAIVAMTLMGGIAGLGGGAVGGVVYNAVSGLYARQAELLVWSAMEEG